MRRVMTLLLAALLFVSTAAWAEEEEAIHVRRVRCGISHFVRNNGTEIRSAVVIFNNGDLVNPTTIERITIFDLFGNVVHDSGPAIGVPHPLNTDFTPPVDITVVPPGAVFYLSTNLIVTGGIAWDANPIPFPNGNDRGQAMGVVVQFSKEGDPKLFQVHGRARSRQRVQISPGFVTQGTELSSNLLFCFRIQND